MNNQLLAWREGEGLEDESIVYINRLILTSDPLEVAERGGCHTNIEK